MTIFRHGTLKLAALGVLAAVLCLAQLAAGWEAPRDPGSIQGLSAELAQVIEWESASPGSSVKKDGENDDPAISAATITAVIDARRSGIPVSRFASDLGLSQAALPAIRAPPGNVSSA